MNIKYNFTVGKRAIVVSECQTTGEHGVVKDINRCNGNTYAVLLLDSGLVRSYNVTSLMPEASGVNGCSAAQFVSTKYDKVAMVKYINGYNTKKLYQYALYEDAEIGDYVVCDSADSFVIGIIVKIHTYEEAVELNKIPTKEIVCVCDTTEYEKRKEKHKKAKELKKKLHEKLMENSADYLYEIMAERDECFKELLDEYRTYTS